MRILILATAFNGLCQRVHQELILLNHLVCVELSSHSEKMLESYNRFLPDIVLCPFLKHRVPDKIWQQTPCLVMHPGVAGDKGPSSLDWAILEEKQYWGATLLEANQYFDAGPVWQTSLFKMRVASKANIYRREITSNACRMIIKVVQHYSKSKQKPAKNIPSNLQSIEPCWKPLMQQSVRKIDWQKDDGKTIVKKINSADSFPGVLEQIDGHDFYLYGASFEQKNTTQFKLGEIIGQKDEAVFMAAIDGGIWIKQLKLKSANQLSMKLPATRALKKLSASYEKLPDIKSEEQSDIKVFVEQSIGYLYFDFYNGAFNTQQCEQLAKKLKQLINNGSIKIIVLMGGSDFWSNGIHLNCIENEKDPALESWKNINAMDDLIEVILHCKSQIIIAGLRNNAGAGGAIMPLACDYIIAREGIVLNPHYCNMGLPGSEYFSYLLPQRVGDRKAAELLQQGLPVLTKQALSINLVDDVFAEDWSEYHQQLKSYCSNLASSNDFDDLLKLKKLLRNTEQFKNSLKLHRAKELKLMKQVFDDPDSDYHRLRYQFVYKLNSGITPKRLNANIEQRSLVY